jgi:hypothetical protein
VTSSVFDSAVSAAIWGWYAGDVRTYDELCVAAQHGVSWHDLDVSGFGCGFARTVDPRYPYGLHLCRPSNRVGIDVPLAGKRLRYVDASDVINCDPPLAGGGAHSDIYRRETARFMLNEILAEPTASAPVSSRVDKPS